MNSYFRTFILYTFGVIDTLMTSISILLFSFFYFDTIKRKKFIYYYLIKYWGRRMFYYTGSKIKIIGWENIDLNKNYLILVNHQSNYDIYIIAGFLNLPICFLSKIENFKIPLIGLAMYRVGCIPLNRTSRSESLKSIYQTAKRYDEGMSIVIYPEGTRSLTGDILPFKSGFLHIVEKVSGTCHILPVCLSGTRNIQEKGKIKINSRKVLIDISSPVIVNSVDLKNKKYQKEILMKLEKTIKNQYKKFY